MADVLDGSEVDAAIGERGLRWRRQGTELVKVVEHPDFARALAYVVAVGALAEEANHHPDVDIRWGTVTLRLSTHSAGGLTAADLALAGRIDGLPAPGR